jgi:hypothetical protein
MEWEGMDASGSNVLYGGKEGAACIIWCKDVMKLCDRLHASSRRELQAPSYFSRTLQETVAKGSPLERDLRALLKTPQVLDVLALAAGKWVAVSPYKLPEGLVCLKRRDITLGESQQQHINMRMEQMEMDLQRQFDKLSQPREESEMEKAMWRKMERLELRLQQYTVGSHLLPPATTPAAAGGSDPPARAAAAEGAGTLGGAAEGPQHPPSYMPLPDGYSWVGSGEKRQIWHEGGTMIFRTMGLIYNLTLTVQTLKGKASPRDLEDFYTIRVLPGEDLDAYTSRFINAADQLVDPVTGEGAVQQDMLRQLYINSLEQAPEFSFGMQQLEE